jgi:hypothetical protein
MKAVEVIRILREALRHAERRLNDIPHRYADTNWQLFCDALQYADSFIDRENEP